MGQGGRKVLAALAVLVAAACGTASGATLTLSSYAAGTWNCTTTIHAGGQTETIKPVAVVTATSTTTGAVTITLRFAGVPGHEKLSGQWSLSGSQLMVQWAKRDEGTAQAKPVTLKTTQLQVRSGTPGNAKWSTVTVNREARSVTFGFPLTPGGAPNQTMTCRKA